MKLSELFLNRFLYRDNLQNLETKDSAFVSADSTTPEPAGVPSGGAAQDINTGNVTINGGQLTPGTIPLSFLDVSNWGWGQTCVFSSTDLDTVSWGAGTFTSAGGDIYSIGAGSTGNMTAKTYIYLDLNVSDTAYQRTTTPADSVGIGKVLIAVAQNASAGNLATYNLSEATQIVGDNILANSINASKIVTGQLIVGTNVGLGTAQDSFGVTTIIGNTVTTGFVNALNVTAQYVTASISISSPTITGGSITIGSGHNVFKANSSGISLGNSTFLSAPFRVNMQGEVTATKITISTNDSSYTGSPIEDAYIGNLTTAKITSGTLNIGSIAQPGVINIAQSSLASSGLLKWSGGSKLWEDTSGYLGLNSVGQRIYFYTGTGTLYALFQRGSQASFFSGVNCGGNFNVQSGYNARIEGGRLYLRPSGTSEYLIGQSGASWLSGGTYSYLAVGGTAALRASSVGVTIYGTGGGFGALYLANSNKINFQSYTLTMTSNKTAIVPTSKGFNALYCMESPEVWFMDFCDEKGKLDPMFEEVTVSPYRYIKCEDGGYQVWAKRKGHEQLRFENKTEEEFLANERFLKMNRPGKPI